MSENVRKALNIILVCADFLLAFLIMDIRAFSRFESFMPSFLFGITLEITAIVVTLSILPVAISVVEFFAAKLGGFMVIIYKFGPILFYRSGGRLHARFVSGCFRPGAMLLKPKSHDKSMKAVHLSGIIFLPVMGVLCYTLPFVIENPYACMAVATAGMIIMYVFIKVVFPVKKPKKLTPEEEEKSRKYLWQNILMMENIYNNIPMVENPDELFYYDEADFAALPNAVIAAVNAADRAFLKGDEEKAADILDTIINNSEVDGSALMIAAGNRLFIELVGECRAEIIEKLYDKRLENYLNGMSKYSIPAARTLFAYLRVYKGLDIEAQKAEKSWKKQLKNFPIQSEIEFDYKYMKIISADDN